MKEGVRACVGSKDQKKNKGGAGGGAAINWLIRGDHEIQIDKLYLWEQIMNAPPHIPHMLSL